MKVAQLQMNVTDDKQTNLRTVRQWCDKIDLAEIDMTFLNEKGEL